MPKFILGTAQFGMHYGINNKNGKIPIKEISAILNQAFKSKINFVDTAHSYKESQKILGRFKRKFSINFNVISKLPICKPDEVFRIVNADIKTLGIKQFYGYLVHDFNEYKKNENIWGKLSELKEYGKIKKIGFSLYYPWQVDYILKKNITVDLIQIPFSIFDQRFAPQLPGLKKRGVEILARSIFLQGLVFMEPGNLPDYFQKIKANIQRLYDLSNTHGIPVAALCLRFVASYKEIDGMVVGVDNLTHLKELICYFRYCSLPGNLRKALTGLRANEEKIILPFKWRFKSSK